MTTVHVYPENDLMDHDTDTDECICMSRIEPVERSDGTIGWVAVHHSLDGREQHEH
jgi:hypothetical protein